MLIPDGTLVIELHQRVLSGDREAFNCLYKHLSRVLLEELHRSFPRTPDDILHQALDDAFLDYLSHPFVITSADASALNAFLRRAAWRNAADATKAIIRRAKREAAYAVFTWSTRRPVSSHGSLDSVRGLRIILALAGNDAERRALTR